MKYLIISHNTRYLADVSTMLALDDYEFDVEMKTTAEKIEETISQMKPTAIFVTNDIVGECKTLTSYKAFGICITKNDEKAFDDTGIKCLGFYRSASAFLDFLEKFDANSYVQTPAPEIKTETVQPNAEPVAPMVENPQNWTCSCGSVNVGNFCSSCGNSKENATKPLASTQIIEEHKETETTIAEEQVKIDLKAQNSNTSVITVYSAKGGVGKTTIACELAAFLSTTCKGRRKARVCVVDYNIDFGDVRQTLGFSDNGMNMVFWANEINARIETGENADDIIYTKTEVETYLQKINLNGNDVFGLIAPINHEDSMIIGQQGALSVMLKSIIDNGDFDYVVCDTGNNTRDSTVLAIQAATLLLIIYTQDINNYYCNASFIETMSKMGLIDADNDNIKMVVNKAKSERYTSLSVAEIEKYTMFECIAKIKDTDELVKANNKSEPLVFTNFSPEFNKEIMKIATQCTNEEISPIKKSGLLKRLFGKG